MSKAKRDEEETPRKKKKPSKEIEDQLDDDFGEDWIE